MKEGKEKEKEKQICGTRLDTRSDLRAKNDTGPRR
jgi:hypothetical protein